MLLHHKYSNKIMLQYILPKLCKGFSDVWRKAVVTVLYKKGDPEKPENYRGISLLSTAYKIYAAVLNERLRSQLKTNSLGIAGRFPKRQKHDRQYIYPATCSREENVYATFVDLKATFDTVKRNKLWKNIENCKIKKGLINKIKEMYEETRNVNKSRRKRKNQKSSGQESDWDKIARSVRLCLQFI